MVEIPEHLLERSRAARARLSGEDAPAPEPAAAAAAPADDDADAPEPSAPAAEPVAPEPVAVAPEPVTPAVAEPEPEPGPGVPAVPEPAAASSGLALPAATAPEAGAPLEVGVRGLAARVGVAVEPFGAVVAPPVPGDEEIASAGISQYTRTWGPRWVLAFSATLGLLTLFYILQYQAGPKCGHGGAVHVSEKDGALVDCEGVKIGPDPNPNTRVGGNIFQANCATCHGAQGQGGVGRALNGTGTLLDDFPTLAAQVEFVQKGSAGLPVYGAQQRKAIGSMPAWAGQLTDFEIVSAVMYEREVLHGGLDPTLPSEALPPPFGTPVTGTITPSVGASTTPTIGGG